VDAGKNARARIPAAIRFLAWLDERDQTLRTATQGDVDEWLIGGKSTRYLVRDFVGWAHANGLCAELVVPWRIREEPVNYLHDAERQELLGSVLREDEQLLKIRVAAALVLLFGLTPTAIIGLQTGDVTRREGRIFLKAGRRPLVMPGALVEELAAQASGHRHPILTAPASPTTRLFPGSAPGQHAGAGRLTTLLNQRLGLRVRQCPQHAISALAHDLHAPVLAELLGIDIGTALRWTKLVKRDWGDYLAQRATELEMPTRPRR